MRPLATLCAAAALAGCAVTPPPQTTLAIAKGDYGFEAIYHGAATTYEAALPLLNKPENAAIKAKVKGYLAQMLTCTSATDPTTCTGYVVLARKAAAISDSSNLASETALIVSLAGQVTATVAGAK